MSRPKSKVISTGNLKRALVQRAQVCLKNAQTEATHGVTANNAYIDLMVEEAYNLLVAQTNEPDYDREALGEIEKLLRPEDYDGDEEKVANAWELANFRLGREK